MIKMDADFKIIKPPKKAFNKAVMGFIEEYLEKIKFLALENLKREVNQITGNLARNVSIELNEAELSGTLLFEASYAAYVEYGTDPHVAPLGPSLPHTGKGARLRISGTPDPTTNPLDFWAWRLGQREPIKNKYGVHTKLGFFLWLKIMKKGTDPHPFLRPAIDRAKLFRSEIAKNHGFEVE